MKRTVSLLKLFILLTIVVAVPMNIVIEHHDIIDHLKNFDDIITFLEQYQWQSILVYMILQILQIIISVLPGQVFHFAAGYLYTFFPALLFTLIGSALGTTITFYLAKVLGKDAVHMFLGEEKTAYYLERLNSRRAYTIVFLIYLIPGIPKDIVSYAAGISEMKFKPFLIFSLIGRIPGMAGSLLIGALYMKEHFILMSIVAAVAVIAFILCLICRRKLQAYIDCFYDKIAG